jgi:hypothetical protein
MSKKNTSTNDLLLELGTVIEQVQVLKRGLKEHPDDEIFSKGIDFMKQEAALIMKEISSRR